MESLGYHAICDSKPNESIHPFTRGRSRPWRNCPEPKAYDHVKEEDEEKIGSCVICGHQSSCTLSSFVVGTAMTGAFLHLGRVFELRHYHDS